MKTPFYAVVAASPAVTALLGAPPRVYPFGENTERPPRYPYVTFQLVGGSPEAALAGLSKVDECMLQVDVWAKSAHDASAVFTALRAAVETKCRITSWRGERKDPATGSYRTGFDCLWTVLGT